MGEVRQLFAVNSLAPTNEDKARYLEYLAACVRNGELAIGKAVLIVSDPDGAVGYHAFGDPHNAGEMVGIVEFAQLKMMAG